MLNKTSESRICAFCKLDHRVYLKKEVSIFDAALLIFITGILAFAIWGGPDLRSLLIFMTLAFVLQVFLRVRYRESVKCPHCGFDAILYGQNTEQAAQKVKAFLEHRKDNLEYVLKPKPRIKPIYKTREEIEAEEKKISLSSNPESEDPIPIENTQKGSRNPKPTIIDTQV